MESGQLDLAAKAAYLKELNKTDPAAVLRHMEQQPQLASEAVAAEYIRALVKSGRSVFSVVFISFVALSFAWLSCRLRDTHPHTVMLAEKVGTLAHAVSKLQWLGMCMGHVA
jgi:hypothetical protein